jgi:integrase
MVLIMRYSNCRAEDVVAMRLADIRFMDEVWEYRPQSHKNQWREEVSRTHTRIVQLGHRCQAVLKPLLDRDPESFLFSPREAKAEHQAARARARQTKRTPSELRCRRVCKPKRTPGERNTVNTFQQTIRRACRQVGLPGWTVLQVRHSRATEIRGRYGLEGAAASLGDSVEAAQIYAERNTALAKRIAHEIG